MNTLDSSVVLASPVSRPRTHFSIRAVGALVATCLILAMPFLPVPEYLITQLNYIGIDAVAVLGIVLLTGS